VGDFLGIRSPINSAPAFPLILQKRVCIIGVRAALQVYFEHESYWEFIEIVLLGHNICVTVRTTP